MRLLFSCLILFFACGCTDQEIHNKGGAECASNNVFSFVPTAAEYGQIKNIPSQAASRLADVYSAHLKQMKAANSILNIGFNDLPNVKLNLQREFSQTIIAAYMDDFLAREITENKILNYYEKNKKNFVSREFEIAHVLIKKNDRMSKDQLNAVEGKLRKIKEDKSLSFSQLVAAYSEDISTKSNDGVIGRFEYELISDEIKPVINGMSLGDVSDFIETSRGMQMFKVVDLVTVPVPFDTARKEIEYKLKKELVDQEVNRLAALVPK